jgi:hypothetical protein
MKMKIIMNKRTKKRIKKGSNDEKDREGKIMTMDNDELVMMKRRMKKLMRKKMLFLS